MLSWCVNPKAMDIVSNELNGLCDDDDNNSSAEDAAMPDSGPIALAVAEEAANNEPPCQLDDVLLSRSGPKTGLDKDMFIDDELDSFAVDDE